MVASDTKTTTLMPVITRKIAPDSIIFTDSYKSYNALDVSEFHHHRIKHPVHFAGGKNHINGIESFCSYTKRRLATFNGIHPKECEFRFNYRHEDFYARLLAEFRKNPL